MAAELLADFEPEIDELTLTPSDGGRFEVTVNDHLIFSKLETHRHAEPGEVLNLLQRYIKSKA